MLQQKAWISYEKKQYIQFRFPKSRKKRIRKKFAKDKRNYKIVIQKTPPVPLCLMIPL